ncbi:hypothetical protein G9464_02755 [Halostella sp. JP-L12]|uniref:hypothetical protein n=1 Tax=Halostella TaxID=1843185 RepID=UPI000EF834EF|nr:MULTISPECIES: hypothetical protein [Halostella]NHN46517.1 hypothetical protein [Halostella sp. JP-L12]
MVSPPNRRQFLTIAGAAAGLAGCSDASGRQTESGTSAGSQVTLQENSDPVILGDGASGVDSATVVGPNSTGPPDGVVIGEGIDASGNVGSTIIGQGNESNGNEEVVVGYDNAGERAAVTVGSGVSNKEESVTLGLNAVGANRNSVAIGSHVNENAPGQDEKWPGIRVAVGSRAAANVRGTAVGPGAGEYGTPGTNVVNIGNEASASGDYSIAIGDQREIGTEGDEETMIKPDADGAVAIGTAVEVGTAQVARIGTSTASNPGPRQLVWQGVEQLADEDYVNQEVTLLMDESNGQFVIKGKDSDGIIQEATVPW